MDIYDIHNVLQHYHDGRCSHEGWRFRGVSSAWTICQKKVALKDKTIAEWLVASSHVRHSNRKLSSGYKRETVVCFLKQPFPD